MINSNNSLIGAIIIAIEAHLKNGLQFKNTTPPYKAVPTHTTSIYAEVPDWQLRQWAALLRQYEAEKDMQNNTENVSTSEKCVKKVPDTLNQCREAFEKYHKETFPFCGVQRVGTDMYDAYISKTVADRFTGWMALWKMRPSEALDYRATIMLQQDENIFSSSSFT